MASFIREGRSFSSSIKEEGRRPQRKGGVANSEKRKTRSGRKSKIKKEQLFPKKNHCTRPLEKKGLAASKKKRGTKRLRKAYSQKTSCWGERTNWGYVRDEKKSPLRQKKGSFGGGKNAYRS